MKIRAFKFIQVLSIIVLTFNIGFSQNQRDEYIISLGLDSLSENGKDTVFHYGSSDALNTFFLNKNLINQKTHIEASDLTALYFSGKLSFNDSLEVRKYWADDYIKYKSKILSFEHRYVDGLDCQKMKFDSMFISNIDKLSEYFPHIDSQLSNREVRILRRAYEDNLANLNRMKKKFLDYELKFHTEFTYAIYNYLEFSFYQMSVIPASYYFDMVSPRKVRFDFLENPEFEEYFDQYGVFQKSVDSLLSKKECKPHGALPYYRLNLMDADRFTKRNALFFALNQGGIRLSSQSDENIPVISESDFTLRNQSSLKLLIDWDNIDQHNMIIDSSRISENYVSLKNRDNDLNITEIKLSKNYQDYIDDVNQLNMMIDSGDAIKVETKNKYTYYKETVDLPGYKLMKGFLLRGRLLISLNKFDVSNQEDSNIDNILNIVK